MVAAHVDDARGGRNAGEGFTRLTRGQRDEKKIDPADLFGLEALDHEASGRMTSHCREERSEALSRAGFAPHEGNLERRVARADAQELPASKPAHPYNSHFHALNHNGDQYYD
jgi:hypothetical protein